MGAWDTAPWDNDSAADWYADLFDKTSLADEVERALQLDPSDRYDEIRAAASVLIMLGRTYIWPIEHLDRHLKLAIEALRAVLRDSDLGDDEVWRAAIESEIAVLEARLERSPAAMPVATPTSWGRFF